MLYICADDYGLSEENCINIEKCIKNGALNKVSIFPNGKVKNIDKRLSEDGVLLSLHLNLIEGKPLAKGEKLSLLVSEEGKFKNSFFGLLLLSIGRKRKEFEKQLYAEIKEQLTFWKENFSGENAMAIDSHQHVHMIPLIFRTLMRVIKDEKLKVGYIRYPKEEIMPYILTPSLYLTYSPVNIIKQWLLKFLGVVNRKELIKSGINTAYFMGVLFSGKMDEKRVRKVVPHYLKIAERKNKDIEILFHPGFLERKEELFDKNKEGFNKFYHSPGRRIEFDSLMNMKLKNNKKEVCENAIH